VFSKNGSTIHIFHLDDDPLILEIFLSQIFSVIHQAAAVRMAIVLFAPL
jgi:hypothetical protein